MDQPLYDDDAERIVLGSLMLAPHLADDVAELLTTGDFHRRAHEVIYARLIAHLGAGEPVDPLGMARALDDAGDLKAVGGAPYLHDLIACVPTPASSVWYARRISAMASRRRLLEASQRIGALVHTPRDVDEVANLAQQAILDATARRRVASTVPLNDLLEEGTERLLAEGGPDRGLSTGLGSLDDVIGGLKPGQLILAAGRPGAGKSVLCLDFARAAIRRATPTLFMSLEMHRDELLARIYAAEASVNLHRLLNGGLRDYERANVRLARERLRPQPMHLDTTRTADLAAVRSSARRIKGRIGLGLVVVDYLQLMTSAGRDTTNRVQELGDISRGLKLLAGDLEVPIVAAAQLNRAGEVRSDRRPQLSDLRESGSLEQDSDIVILIHRPDYYDPKARPGEVDLIIAKNRNGPQMTVVAHAQLEYARFVDIGVPS